MARCWSHLGAKGISTDDTGLNKQIPGTSRPQGVHNLSRFRNNQNLKLPKTCQSIGVLWKTILCPWSGPPSYLDQWFFLGGRYWKVVCENHLWNHGWAEAETKFGRPSPSARFMLLVFGTNPWRYQSWTEWQSGHLQCELDMQASIATYGRVQFQWKNLPLRERFQNRCLFNFNVEFEC